MYRSFYKLDSIPFRLTPDPRFFYASESHERALAYLHYALQQRTGLVVVSGDAGSGKTELISRFSSDISSNSGINYKIMSAHSKKENLLDRVFTLFLNRSVSNLLDDQEKLKALQLFLNQELSHNTHPLLVIDEANNLSIDSLSVLSQLTSLRTDDKPLLQCFLLGQQPILSKLELPKLKPLQQQVLIFTHLEGLDLSDTRGYIEHRLTCSGWKKDPSFDERVFVQIYQFTQGVPRTINALCSRILVECCLDQKHQVDVDTATRIINEMQEETIIPRQSLDLDFSQYGKAEMASIIQSGSGIESQKGKQKIVPAQKDLVTAEINAEQSYTSIKLPAGDFNTSENTVTENTAIMQKVTSLKSVGSEKFENTTINKNVNDLKNTETEDASVMQKVTNRKSVGNEKTEIAVNKHAVSDLKSKISETTKNVKLDTNEKLMAPHPSVPKTASHDSQILPLESEKTSATENNQYVHRSFMPAATVKNTISSQSQIRAKSDLLSKPEIGGPSNRGIAQTSKIRHRESGLLDKDLRALASCFEHPVETGQNKDKPVQHSGVEKSPSNGEQKHNIDAIYGAVLEKVSPTLKKVTENAQRKIPIINKLINLFPISYSGVIISISILIVFWFFIYGPGLGLTMSILKYFASLAGN